MVNLLDCGTTDRDRVTVKDVLPGIPRYHVNVTLKFPVLFFIFVFILCQ